MKKFLIIFFSIFLLTSLTTFNPNYFDIGFQFFKIKKIEIKNLKVLDKKKLKIYFIKNYPTQAYLFWMKKKIDKILNSNIWLQLIHFR